MKILVVHNLHRKGSTSGDDEVFRNEASLLERYGNEVIRYSVINDSFDQQILLRKIFAAVSMIWSWKHYKAIQKLIKTCKPDVVHVHTFFPLLSPSILYAAKRCGCKVVATLHDTRFVCPCATSLRGSKLCNDCADGRYFRMGIYKCFKGSRLQSFFVALIFKYHRMRKSLYNQIDCYICLNEEQISLLKSSGFNADKIVKKYNFTPDVESNLQIADFDWLPKRYVVFYGRIGEEKGIRVLMQIWDRISDIPLVVMGSGPLEGLFREWAEKKQNVFYLGYTRHNECLSMVKRSEFVVFPSTWYEGCSMVEIETQSLGKPLIASDLGFSAEAIDDGINGYKIPVGDINGFVRVIEELWNCPELCIKMGEQARKDYIKKYRAEENYKQLIKIYGSLF